MSLARAFIIAVKKRVVPAMKAYGYDLSTLTGEARFKAENAIMRIKDMDDIRAGRARLLNDAAMFHTSPRNYEDDPT